MNKVQHIDKDLSLCEENLTNVERVSSIKIAPIDNANTNVKAISNHLGVQAAAKIKEQNDRDICLHILHVI